MSCLQSFQLSFKKFLALCTIFLFVVNAKAQLELNSGGSDYSNQNGEVSFTLGSLATQFLENSEFSVLFGVQQPDFAELGSTLAILDLQTRVFPNPFKNYIKIINTSTRNIIDVQIFNSIGALVMHHKNAFYNEDLLDVSLLPSGTYFMQISFDSKTKYSYKLIKL